MNQATPSERARISLEGLSIGDAFGQRFFFPWVVERSTPRCLPDPPWHYTDDTEMALAIVQVLEEAGEVDQDLLAQTFARRFLADPGRGYGEGARRLLLEVSRGVDWRVASRSLFGGTGSFGNGGAMRVAPLGAWFADDPVLTIEQARRSAEVTHGHPEGQAGAIAVALAAGWVWRWSQSGRKSSSTEMLPWIASLLDPCEVRTGIEKAIGIPLDAWAFDTARELGCGEQISAQDTVPYCLWVAAAHLGDYCEALWITARTGGDIDTNCAIVGGILSLSEDGIPEKWRNSREPLQW